MGAYNATTHALAGFRGKVPERDGKREGQRKR